MKGNNGGIKADLLITGASQLVTLAGPPGPRRGRSMQDIGVIENGALAALGEKIVAVGTSAEVKERVILEDGSQVVDAGGRVVMPGFVDPHTHPVYAGSREHELALKLAGRSYLEILKSGGGILSTVRATRAASREDLAEQTARRLDLLLEHGVTTAEAKSGYGLSLEHEIRSLEVLRELNRRHPVDLIPTFMGAHAVPPEYRDNPGRYVDLVIGEMIPAVASDGLAEYCDVFCEEGVFDTEQSEKILCAGLALGLKPRIHADELADTGGAALAARLGAVTADHLLFASDQGIEALAEAGVMAVLLPCTSFNLASGRYARARKMLEANLAVAISTDCNPGSSPTQSMQLAITLACLYLRMTPEEAITAATLNGAWAVGMGNLAGSLEPGKLADVLIIDAPNYLHLPYHFGVNLIHSVFKRGTLVYSRSRVRRNSKEAWR
ncbi:MAG: imidazolonepropionase [Peptococcaceae bacterium]|nr:imidazolonepropionase [Peptococcaceae bacterium]